MFLRIFRVLQIALTLAAGFFVYQSAVFFWHSLRDWTRGENGVTQGLTLLSGGLGAAGLLNVIEAIIRLIKRESVTSQAMIVSVIRLSIFVVLLRALHKMYFTIQEQNAD